ncbi:MAG: hypothetical protein WA782_21395 [Sulfitobacter sp.]
MSAPFTYTAQGRSARTALVVAFLWVGLAILWITFDAALSIVGFLALFTLPACWDLFSNPASGLTLGTHDITWFSGRRTATVPLDEIDHIRLDTRLDFSVKATLVLKTGAKVRLPFEATPPHQPFEDALNAKGVTTKRFHFQLMQ